MIFVTDSDLSPAAHLAFAQSFVDLDEPHLHYPHVGGFENIVLLENDPSKPPDTNPWHSDLTFKSEQPFASILVAREVPEVGGDAMWSSSYAAYDRLPPDIKSELERLEAVHDIGDFRNRFAGSSDELAKAMARFGQQIRPLIGVHPVTGRTFLNFNEAFVTHIVGLTIYEANSLKSWLATHMN